MKQYNSTKEAAQDTLFNGEIIEVCGRPVTVVSWPNKNKITTGSYLVKDGGDIEVSGEAEAFVFEKGCASARNGGVVNVYKDGIGLAFNNGRVGVFEGGRGEARKGGRVDVYQDGCGGAIDGGEAYAHEGGLIVVYKNSTGVAYEHGRAIVLKGGVVNNRGGTIDADIGGKIIDHNQEE